MSRTFILHTPLPDEDLLRFVSLSGQEALSTVSHFHLELRSVSPDVSANDLLGKSMTVEVVNQEGNSRYLNAIVTEFNFIGPANSASLLYRYEAKLSSWLWLADKVADARIFQKLSAPQIISAVLQGFGMPFEMALLESYSPVEYRVQFQETSLNFVMRLAEEAGIFFYVKHELGSHTLVFTDGKHSTLPDYATIPFLTPSQKTLEMEEYISEWMVQKQVHSGRYSTRSYNFKAPNSPLEQIQEQPKDHANDTLEIYEWSGTYDARDTGGKLAEVRREQQQLHFETATASSNVRGIAPGFYFTLSDHPRATANAEYLIVSANYSFQETADTTGGDDGSNSWSVGFTARTSKERYWPPRATTKPRVHGVQTAVVAGPAGKEQWTNEYGQVKLTFFWDRYAKHNENDSKWVRVASSWAGSNWGESMVPRIGQEVVVEFEDGDPDRPLVVSRVNNFNQMPTSFSDTGDLPGNAAIAGIKSQELHGERYNQLLMDDTKGEIRVQLASEHAKTQLNMGYLVHPRDVSAQPRGEGFELRTDTWGVTRSMQGMLFTADPRIDADGNAMSRDELVRDLEQALSLAQSINKIASKNQGTSADQNPQKDQLKDVKGMASDSNAEKNNANGGGDAVFAMRAPAGIALGTPLSTTITSGQHLDAVAQKNLHATAGQMINLNAKENISQFAQNVGIKSIALAGDQLIQAQRNDIQVAANRNVKITSSQAQVLFAAKKNITITSGGGYIKIADGSIEIHCSGTMSLKAGNYAWTGPAEEPAKLPTFGEAQLKGCATFTQVAASTGAAAVALD